MVLPSALGIYLSDSTVSSSGPGTLDGGYHPFAPVFQEIWDIANRVTVW